MTTRSTYASNTVGKLQHGTRLILLTRSMNPENRLQPVIVLRHPRLEGLAHSGLCSHRISIFDSHRTPHTVCSVCTSSTASHKTWSHPQGQGSDDTATDGRAIRGNPSNYNLAPVVLRCPYFAQDAYHHSWLPPLDYSSAHESILEGFRDT